MPVTRSTLVLALLALAAVVVPGAANASTSTASRCFGAAAMASSTCPDTTSGPLTPEPDNAIDDRPAAYRGGSAHDCFASAPDYALTVCTFGDSTATVQVALVGNSHAGEWLPALDIVAHRHHWKIVTYLASKCAYADTLEQLQSDAASRACLAWVHSAQRQLLQGRFDTIVMSNRVAAPAAGHTLAGSYPSYQRGYTTLLRNLHAAHKRVYGIRDTPYPGYDVPSCLEANSNDYLACSGTPDAWLPPEPLYAAAQSVHDPRISVGNLTRYFCHPDRCLSAIGGVTVYYDDMHVGATFSASVAPYLDYLLTKFIRATG